MSSFAASFWTFIGFTSSSKRALPTLISEVTARPSSASVHNRTGYSAPSLRSPQLAFESPLFTSHPSRFVSLSELIPGLSPPGEIELEVLESIEAEGEILAVETNEEDLAKRLCRSLAYSYLPTEPVEAPRSQLSLFLSSFTKPKGPTEPELTPDLEAWAEKLGMDHKEFIDWYTGGRGFVRCAGPR
ncbi:hypothetical protein JCM16303_001666 [Sporobolomyces ruberrimus]